jgi:3-dehydroquinate synthase class II
LQVHAYTLGEQDGSRTAYLSELCSGKVVQIADAEGRTRAATVGRVKVLLSCRHAVSS